MKLLKKKRGKCWSQQLLDIVNLLIYWLTRATERDLLIKLIISSFVFIILLIVCFYYYYFFFVSSSSPAWSWNARNLLPRRLKSSVTTSWYLLISRHLFFHLSNLSLVQSFSSIISFALFTQYYEMSYGLNVEMHKQVSICWLFFLTIDVRYIYHSIPALWIVDSLSDVNSCFDMKRVLRLVVDYVTRAIGRLKRNRKSNRCHRTNTLLNNWP